MATPCLSYYGFSAITTTRIADQRCDVGFAGRSRPRGTALPAAPATGSDGKVSPAGTPAQRMASDMPLARTGPGCGSRSTPPRASPAPQSAHRPRWRALRPFWNYKPRLCTSIGYVEVWTAARRSSTSRPVPATDIRACGTAGILRGTTSGPRFRRAPASGGQAAPTREQNRFFNCPRRTSSVTWATCDARETVM